MSEQPVFSALGENFCESTFPTNFGSGLLLYLYIFYMFYISKQKSCCFFKMKKLVCRRSNCGHKGTLHRC